MENVQFTARQYTKTLSTGRTVTLALSDDGAHWGLDIGDPADPAERIRFALTSEAFAAVEEIAERLRRPITHQRWEYVLSDIDVRGAS